MILMAMLQIATALLSIYKYSINSVCCSYYNKIPQALRYATLSTLSNP